MRAAPIRVALLEESKEATRALISTLATDTDLQVVGVVSTLGSLRMRLKLWSPDVVLIGPGSGTGVSGLDAGVGALTHLAGVVVVRDRPVATTDSARTGAPMTQWLPTSSSLTDVRNALVSAADNRRFAHDGCLAL